MENKQQPPIDLVKIFKTLLNHKKYYFIILPIVFILSCIYIFSLPRYYKTDMKLAPELNNGKSPSSLSSIAANFGFDLENIHSSDAISPLLYPELMEDNGFVTSLWSIPVADKADSIHTTYYNYLEKHQKSAWWEPATQAIRSLFKKEDIDTRTTSKTKVPFDPYKLSKIQNEVTGVIKGNIKIDFDKKTMIITINTQDQDPLICKTLADTIAKKLQRFITEYRTSKARIDVAHYQQLSEKAKKEYEDIRDKYVHFADANTDIILESVKAKLEDMENDMQLKYNNYTMLQAQLQAAEAKVQERTPVFTIIKGADVPMKPAGPKRLIFVAIMLILATAFISIYILAKASKTSS